MAGAERFELSTRGFGGDVEAPSPRGGLPVCPRMRGLGKLDAPRIDALLMIWKNHRVLVSICRVDGSIKIVANRCNNWWTNRIRKLLNCIST